ncbi:MAG: glycosyltransferase [Gammaproteobacteria bacterium]
MSARPCLAYVVNTLNPGGTERLVFEMSVRFSKDFDLLVVCLDDVGAWGRELRARGIAVHCVWRQPGLDLSMPRRLANLFRAHGVRIIHAHQCTPWFYAALSRLHYSEPRLLLEEHGRFFPEVPNAKRALVNRLLIRKLTHRFVGVSEDIRNRLHRYEGLDLGEIEVVYNGVAPQPALEADARRAKRVALGFADTDFVVGTVGRFDPIKNLPMLIDGIAGAAGKVPSVRGLLVGDGPEMPAVRVRLAATGQTERIVLTGFRQDARELAQCMDLFVLASFSEGTSMALLEAMSARVPVAVTRVGGNPEIVSAGQTGWVVESGAVPELVEAIIEAATDPGRRAGFAEAGLRRFEERFSFERMLGLYRSMYEQWLPAPAKHGEAPQAT